MLECVINISEGRDNAVLAALAGACEGSLLDVHSDNEHHRSVFTLAGSGVVEDAKRLAAAAVARLDLADHDGVHPRFGVVDVVPFVPLEASRIADAVAARDAFAAWLSDELAVPALLYGAERSLPEVRKGAFDTVSPLRDLPLHPTAGACAVGARPVMLAYNLWLQTSLAHAKRIAKAVRTPTMRTLAFAVGDYVQVSCNLIEPMHTGPALAFDAVQAHAPVVRSELVGLITSDVLHAQPRERWEELGIGEDVTVEARLRGLATGSA